MNLLKIKNGFLTFLNGYIFPVCVAVLALISSIFGLEIVTICAIAIICSLGIIFCDDLRFMLSPVLFITFAISNKSLSSGLFGKTGFVISVVVAILVLVGSIIAHFVIYKVSFKPVLKSKLFPAFIVLFLVYLLGGAFNLKKYSIDGVNLGGFSIEGLIFVLVMILMLSIPFFLLGSGIKSSSDLRKYFVWVLFLGSIIVTLSVFHLICFGDVFKNGSIIKEKIVLGWSTWNGIGAILTVLLPVHFYIASIYKRGYIFFITGIISYLAIVLTLSRASLLVSTLILILCVIYGCIKGENKKLFRILTLVGIIVAILGIIILWNKISAVLVDYLNRGFDDNGRFQLYVWALQTFLRHPILGSGFEYVYVIKPVQSDILAIGTPFLCHNTLIEILAACGIIGFCGYIYHRYKTAKLFIERRRDSFSVFMALCIIGLLLTSLLDVHFFIFYHILYYSSILTMVEKVSSTEIKQTECSSCENISE